MVVFLACALVNLTSLGITSPTKNSEADLTFSHYAFNLTFYICSAGILGCGGVSFLFFLRHGEMWESDAMYAVGQHAVHVTEKLGRDNETDALGGRHAMDG